MTTKYTRPPGFPQLGCTYIYPNARYPNAHCRIIEDRGGGYYRVIVRQYLGSQHRDSHSALVWWNDLGDQVD